DVSISSGCSLANSRALIFPSGVFAALSKVAAVRTWTGESTAVKFTSTGTDKDHRAYVAALKVTYKN
ncbi:MAG: hypothetical protein J6U49_06315, partial [Alistipes sp.]|nr:hypothetical protein [Alistipes sp.]